MEIDSGTSRKAAAQSLATKAESEAAKRIETARKRVREAEMEAQQQLDRQRDSYEKRSEMERARLEGSLDQQRYTGYEKIREMQRASETEEQRLRRQAEKEISDLKTHYDSTTHTTEAEGEKKFRQSLAENFRQEEMLRLKHQDQVETMNREQRAEMARLKSDRDMGVEQMMKLTHDERARLQEQTRTSIAESKDHYEDIYSTTLKRQHHALDSVGAAANRQLRELRESSSHRLAAYSDRQRDPFYRMVNLNAEIQETDDAFILSARIPEHEQDRIQVTVRGNELVISGQRRNEEKLELEPGRVQRTSAYQSFSESFPIHWPVEPKGMIREFQGESLTVRIPKKQTYAAEQFKAKKQAPRARLEQPQFPTNLPGESELKESLAQKREAEPLPSEKRGRSSRTIG